jgi:hypothetical protein
MLDGRVPTNLFLVSTSETTLHDELVEHDAGPHCTPNQEHTPAEDAESLFDSQSLAFLQVELPPVDAKRSISASRSSERSCALQKKNGAARASQSRARTRRLRGDII